MKKHILILYTIAALVGCAKKQPTVTENPDIITPELVTETLQTTTADSLYDASQYVCDLNAVGSMVTSNKDTPMYRLPSADSEQIGLFKSGESGFVKQVGMRADKNKDLYWIYLCNSSQNSSGWIINSKEQPFANTTPGKQTNGNTLIYERINADITIEPQISISQSRHPSGPYKFQTSPSGKRWAYSTNSTLSIFTEDKGTVTNTQVSIPKDSYSEATYTIPFTFITDDLIYFCYDCFPLDTRYTLFSYNITTNQIKKVLNYEKAYDNGPVYQTEEVYVSPDKNFYYFVTKSGVFSYNVKKQEIYKHTFNDLTRDRHLQYGKIVFNELGDALFSVTGYNNGLHPEYRPDHAMVYIKAESWPHEEIKFMQVMTSIAGYTFTDKNKAVLLDDRLIVYDFSDPSDTYIQPEKQTPLPVKLTDSYEDYYSYRGITFYTNLLVDKKSEVLALIAQNGAKKSISFYSLSTLDFLYCQNLRKDKDLIHYELNNNKLTLVYKDDSQTITDRYTITVKKHVTEHSFYEPLRINQACICAYSYYNITVPEKDIFYQYLFLPNNIYFEHVLSGEAGLLAGVAGAYEVFDDHIETYEPTAFYDCYDTNSTYDFHVTPREATYTFTYQNENLGHRYMDYQCTLTFGQERYNPSTHQYTGVQYEDALYKRYALAFNELSETTDIIGEFTDTDYKVVRDTQRFGAAPIPAGKIITAKYLEYGLLDEYTISIISRVKPLERVNFYLWPEDMGPIACDDLVLAESDTLPASITITRDTRYSKKWIPVWYNTILSSDKKLEDYSQYYKEHKDNRKFRMYQTHKVDFRNTFLTFSLPNRDVYFLIRKIHQDNNRWYITAEIASRAQADFNQFFGNDSFDNLPDLTNNRIAEFIIEQNGNFIKLYNAENDGLIVELMCVDQDWMEAMVKYIKSDKHYNPSGIKEITWQSESKPTPLVPGHDEQEPSTEKTELTLMK
ncbi:MAG: hypothetical protein K6E51_00540 [Treponema sp.]|nr:hypothetical protein [Treponema sp.]